MQKVEVWCDGSCWPNPGGPGGFGAVLICGPHRREIKGGVRASTNNRMEIMSVIAALSALNRPTWATVYSDSQYTVNGAKWAAGWAKRGWCGSDGNLIKNRDLWEIMLKLMNLHHVEMEWVKGHNGHPENELCDRLAGEGAKLPNLPADKGFQLYLQRLECKKRTVVI